MKTRILKYAAISSLLVISAGCSVMKGSAAENEIDLVCNMKVQRSEAYTYKYEGKKYYFDTYTCKQSFKMNPKKFIENQCTPKK